MAAHGKTCYPTIAAHLGILTFKFGLQPVQGGGWQLTNIATHGMWLSWQNAQVAVNMSMLPTEIPWPVQSPGFAAEIPMLATFNVPIFAAKIRSQRGGCNPTCTPSLATNQVCKFQSSFTNFAWVYTRVMVQQNCISAPTISLLALSWTK